MGVLDDAIREHLELKRRHGAEEAEVRRQEEEALGPARREVAPAETDADAADAQAGTEVPQADQEQLPEAHADEAAMLGQAPETGVEDAPVGEAAPHADAAHHDELAQHETPAVRDEPAQEEPALEAEPGVGHEESAPSHDEGSALREDEPALREDEPALREDEPALREATLGDPDLEDDKDFGDETAMYDVEGEFDDEDDSAESDPFDGRESHSADGRRGDTPAQGFAALDEDDLLEDEDEDEGEATGDVDVLEDTPDFLQETPEHDRLWFEQKPPRDFDFD
jgi:hypothetical protein